MKRNIALKWVNLSISTGDCTHIRGVFSALSSIYDRVFLQKKLTALNKKSPSQISYTVLNTPILSFLRWGYIYSSYFLKSASFGRISRNYAETVPFHKISASENQVKLRYFSQWDLLVFYFGELTHSVPACLEACQASMMELFAKIINSQQQLFLNVMRNCWSHNF